jgi:hypothetical protein
LLRCCALRFISSLTCRSGQFCFSGFVRRWVSTCHRHQVCFGLLYPVLIRLLSPVDLSSPFFAQPVSTSREPIFFLLQDLIFRVLHHHSRIIRKLIFVLRSAHQLGSPLIHPAAGLLPISVLASRPRLLFLLRDLRFSVKLVVFCLFSLISVVCPTQYRSLVLGPAGHAADLLFRFSLPLANLIWFHWPTQANCFYCCQILASISSHAAFISKVQLLIRSSFFGRRIPPVLIH